MSPSPWGRARVECGTWGGHRWDEVEGTRDRIILTDEIWGGLCLPSTILPTLPVPVKSRTPIIFQIFIVNKFCDIAGGFPGARAGAERGAHGISGNGGSGGSPVRAKQERKMRHRHSRGAAKPPPHDPGPHPGCGQ